MYGKIGKLLKFESDEMETSEINEMLRYRYRSRVIVPIVAINNESVTALEQAIALSDDITAFCACSDEQSCKKIKEDFKLLDTDIKLVVKHSDHLTATEQLLDYIDSPEYNCMGREFITVILPQIPLRKHWWNLFPDRKKSYIEGKLKCHKNVVIMKMSSPNQDNNIVYCKIELRNRK